MNLRDTDKLILGFLIGMITLLLIECAFVSGTLLAFSPIHDLMTALDN